MRAWVSLKSKTGFVWVRLWQGFLGQMSNRVMTAPCFVDVLNLAGVVQNLKHARGFFIMGR